MNLSPLLSVSGSSGEASWTRGRTLAMLFSCLAALAAIDICVLEYIIKPVHRQHQVPWSAFTAPLTIMGKSYPLLVWHYFFIPLGFFLFALLGVASGRWVVFGAGSVMFVGGMEDTLYYLFQLQWLPASLPWLDANFFLYAIARLLGETHVSGTAVALGNGITLVGAWWMLGRLNSESTGN